MEIHAIRTEGLGDTTYLLAHEGAVLVVDPQRDIDRFLGVVESSGAGSCLVLETHVHNDYLSGGQHLATELDAELVMPAGAAPVFRHRPAFHHEDIDIGPMVIRPIHTPGHTPEHISYLVLIEGREVAVFTGGSLLAGSAGRTDLLGIDRAATLARLQHGSIHRLAALPGDTRLCPTHGAGSFCTAGAAGESESTVADEAANNPALAYLDEEAFVKGQLSGLPPYPGYYRHMGPINLTGAPRFLGIEIPEIKSSDLAMWDDEVSVVDCRPPARYAAGHLPGSISVELRPEFGVWVGWVVEFGTPLVLVLDSEQDLDEAVRQLSRIGFDDIRGVVRELEMWPEPLDSLLTASPAEFARAVAGGAQVIDTRSPQEWASGTITGSTLLYVPDILDLAPTTLDADRQVWVACASGFRAAIGASLLSAAGLDPVILTDAGVTDVLTAMSDNER